MERNGIISTTPPIVNGTNGVDASKTFYWTSEHSNNIVMTYFNIIKIDGHEENIQIGKIYGDGKNPSVGDQIVYSETDKTRFFIITNVSGTNVETETLSEWRSDPSVPGTNTERANIDIDISFTVVNLNEKFASDDQGDKSLSENISTRSSGILLNTVISSNNRMALGETKITLEFYNPLSSPAMDTMMLNFFDQYNRQPNTSVITNHTNFSKTYRGYINTYSRVARDYKTNYVGSTKYPVALNNFDNEKLDNFVIIAKDFNDSKDNSVHVNQSTINRNSLRLRYLDDFSFPYCMLVITELGDDGHIYITTDQQDTVDINFYHKSISEIVMEIVNIQWTNYTVTIGDPETSEPTSVIFKSDVGTASVTIEISESSTVNYELRMMPDSIGTSLSEPYRCYAYIYIPNSIRDYTKHLIGEVDLSRVLPAN